VAPRSPRDALDEREQQDALEKDLWSLITRYRSEFNLSYASVVGTMAITLHALQDEAIGDDD
jgi:hypothetical protein